MKYERSSEDTRIDPIHAFDAGVSEDNISITLQRPEFEATDVFIATKPTRSFSELSSFEPNSSLLTGSLPCSNSRLPPEESLDPSSERRSDDREKPDGACCVLSERDFLRKPKQKQMGMTSDSHERPKQTRRGSDERRIRRSSSESYRENQEEYVYTAS